jgi:hypothetical protein
MILAGYQFHHGAAEAVAAAAATATVSAWILVAHTS